MEAGCGADTCGLVSGNAGRELAPGDEDVLTAVVGKGLAGEAAVERLEFEAGHVEQAELLVPGGPPQGARGAVLEDDVDPVAAR